jgi:glycosyltransferase involved in cell wall biosynthesis
MKIIQVLNHFLPYQTAGTEIYVWSLCKQLQQFDHGVSVVIPNYESSVSENYIYDGIEVFKYAEPSKPDRALITGQRTSEGLLFFRQYLKEQKPDIVHFHGVAGSNGISVAHLETAKELGVKVIYTIHLASVTCNTGTLMYQQKTICDGMIRISKCTYCSLQKRTGNSFNAAMASGISLPLYEMGINTLKWNNTAGTILSYPFQVKNLQHKLRRIAAACDMIMPITNWYKEVLLKNGVEENKLKVVLQGLPINISQVENIPIQLPLRLVFVGRIDQLKGIDLLIDAVGKFNNNEIVLDIYGTTDDRTFLEACKKRAQPFGNIEWKGLLPPAEVTRTLAQYHALILPSVVAEMSPLVIQEAFAAKIPVIGSDIYGIAEQVKDGVNGFLFTINSVSSLHEVLQRLVDSPHILSQLSDNIIAPRSFANVAKETINIYNAVLSTAKSG